MPLQIFTPSIAPSPGTQSKPKVSLNVAGFGDGYTQASPRGLNHIRQNITLRWGGLTEPQMLELKTFFENHGGYRPFYYKPRGFSELLKFTCSDWSVSDNTPWMFEAKFEQNYTNEV